MNMICRLNALLSPDLDKNYKKFPDYSRFSLTFCKNGLFSRFSRLDTLSIEEAIKQTSFFIDQHKSLQRSHKYVTQIQMQLFVCGYRKCDLIVWSRNWLLCSTVTRDDELLEIGEICQNFYTRSNTLIIRY